MINESYLFDIRQDVMPAQSSPQFYEGRYVLEGANPFDLAESYDVGASTIKAADSTDSCTYNLWPCANTVEE